MSKLPENWDIKTLSSIANLEMGQSPPSSSYNDVREGIPFFQGKADFGNKYPKVRYWCTAPTKFADEKDILISVRAPVGDLNISDIRSCIGRGLAAIQAKKNYSQVFLYFALEYLKNELELLSQGSTFEAITGKELKAFKVLLPHKEDEQKIIAEILTSVDRAIELTEKEIDKLKDLKKGHIEKSFALNNNEKIKLKELADLQTGPFGSQLHASDYVEKGIPLIMPKDIINFKINVSNSTAKITTQMASDLNKYNCKKGDILFSRRGDIGRCAPVEGDGLFCGTGCLIVRPKNGKVSTPYLLGYFKSHFAQHWLNNNAVGQTMLNLSTSILGDLPVKVCSLDLQEKILKLLGSIERQIFNKERSLNYLAMIKKALMQDLLTGKVRVKL